MEVVMFIVTDSLLIRIEWKRFDLLISLKG